MEEAMEEAAEAAADVAEATAELAAGALASGMLMGAPAAEQVDSTSGDGGGLVGRTAGTLNTGLNLGQELSTLLAVACEVGKRGAAVAGEGPTKQLSCALARRDVVKLSGANGGQSDDGSDGEVDTAKGILFAPFEICVQPLEVLLNVVELDDATPDYQLLAAADRDWTDDGKVYCLPLPRNEARRVSPNKWS
ncbi:unnamed protein product [Alternaria alternata]